MPRQRGIDDSGLTRTTRAIEAGSEPGQALGAALQQCGSDRRRRGGVADPHLAEDDEIGLTCGRTLDGTLAAVKGKREIGRGKRSLLAEVARAAARLVGDDAGNRRFRKRSGVDDFERRAELARQHGNRGASGGEVRHHRNGHLLRIGGDALCGNAVIASEYDDRHAVGARTIGVLQTCERDREPFEPAQRAGRLRELILARPRRLTVHRRDGRALLIDPIWKHASLAHADPRLMM